MTTILSAEAVDLDQIIMLTVTLTQGDQTVVKGSTQPCMEHLMIEVGDTVVGRIRSATIDVCFCNSRVHCIRLRYYEYGIMYVNM